MSLRTNRIMKENNMRKPQPNPKVAVGTSLLTQLTNKTGAVTKLLTTIVAPVSLTLLVNTMIAPESIEYFVNGKTIVLNTPKGFAPSVLAASSNSISILSTAADMDLTK
jgi:hydrogenase maturation factor HypF (carbamoyltransferase family)